MTTEIEPVFVVFPSWGQARRSDAGTSCESVGRSQSRSRAQRRGIHKSSLRSFAYGAESTREQRRLVVVALLICGQAAQGCEPCAAFWLR